MDPRPVFWSVALLDLSAVLLLALLGLRRIRAGDWRGHRNRMLAAAALIAVFLVAYVLKVEWIGHEDVASWSDFRIAILRIHEFGIAAMLGGGLYAGYRAWRFRSGLPAAAVLPQVDPGAAARVGHRWAGRIALAGTGLAWATALVLLTGMYD